MSKMLSENFFDIISLHELSARQGFSDDLLEVGEKNPVVVALTADLKESTHLELFAKKFSERLISIEFKLTPLTDGVVGGIVRILTPLPSRPCRDGSFFLPLT